MKRQMVMGRAEGGRAGSGRKQRERTAKGKWQRACPEQSEGANGKNERTGRASGWLEADGWELRAFWKTKPPICLKTKDRAVEKSGTKPPF